MQRLLAQNAALSKCLFRQSAKLAAARAAHAAQVEAHGAQVEQFHYSPLRFSEDAGAMVVRAAQA